MPGEEKVKERGRKEEGREGGREKRKGGDRKEENMYLYLIILSMQDSCI